MVHSKRKHACSRAARKDSSSEAPRELSPHCCMNEFSFQGKLKKPLKFHLAFLSILLMVFIVSIDATALAVVIPTITAEFNGTSLQAFWANASFISVVTVVLPVYTGLSEVIGRRLPLYTAFFLFTVGSIVFATAQSLPTIILARALQGSGCGGIDVLNEILVADITTLQERAFYIGLVSLPFALGSVLGPVVGALLGEHVSWRWIGWINLPLVGVCLPLSIFCLTLTPLEGTLLKQLSTFDWCGLALFVVGSVSLTLPLSWAGVMYPVHSWRTLVPLVGGIAVLVVLAWYESRACHPIFPYRIFRNRTAASALVLSFVHGMIFYTLIFHLPLFFQSVSLETPIQSSVSLIPFYAVLMAFTGIAAVGIEWTRRYRWSVLLSWALTSVGLGLFTLWGPQVSVAETVGFQTVAAIGLGSLFTALPIAMQACTSYEDHGHAVGILVAFRLFGASIGLAISASVFSNEFGGNITSLGGLHSTADLMQGESKALGFIPLLRELDLPSAAIESIQNAYSVSFRVIFYFLSGISCFGFVVALFTKEWSIESNEPGRQAFVA